MSPLRRRMIEDMQICNLTVNTQRVYVAQVVHFACHFRKSPDLLGPAEIRTYLIHLTRERHLAASSVIVAVSALRFFYTVTLKRPWVVADDIPAGRQAKKLPIVLSQDEVACFLGAVDNLKQRMVLTVCYATGLRISEAVHLTAAAIDSKRMVIRVEQGKGPWNRVTPAKLRAWLHYFLAPARGSQFKLCVNPPEDLDGLSPSQLKELVARLLDKMTELERINAEQREGVRAAEGIEGPSGHQAERHGQIHRTVQVGHARKAPRPWQGQAACCRRGSDHQGGRPGRITLQGL